MVAWEFSGKTSGDSPGLFMSLIMRPREMRGGPLSGPHTRGAEHHTILHRNAGFRTRFPIEAIIYNGLWNRRDLNPTLGELGF